MNSSDSESTSGIDVLELNTRFETLAERVAGVASVAAVFLFWGGWFGLPRGRRFRGEPRPPNPDLLPWAIVSLAVALIFWLIRWQTRSYRLIDRRTAEIRHRFRLFGIEREWRLLGREEVLAISSNGRPGYRRSLMVTGWEYRVEAISKTGRRVPLSDWIEGEPLGLLAEVYADRLGVRFEPPVSEHRLRLRRTAEGVNLAFVPPSILGNPWILLLMGLLGLMFTVQLLGWLLGKP